MTKSRLPTYFVSHGGGPWPYMKDMLERVYSKLASSLKAMPREIGGKPKAVLMISAHWREKEFAISTHPQPPMIYDYGGFPAHTYQVTYAAPGSPELAKQVHELLSKAGIAADLDDMRGYDHGTFVPLAVIFPDADVPVVQVSLKKRYDPAEHIALGRALASLRYEGVLIIGSGLSYHNLGQFDASAHGPSKEFDDWLQAIVKQRPNERVTSLLNWSKAPSARASHPREDHLIPLMVAVGAAQEEAADCVYHEEDFMGGIVVSSFKFG